MWTTDAPASRCDHQGCTNCEEATLPPLMLKSTSCGCDTLCSNSCCCRHIFSATLLVHLSWSCRFRRTFLLHSSLSSLCLLWCPRLAHSQRWKMLKMRERRLVGHCELEKHSGLVLSHPEANFTLRGSSDHFQWNLSITETWAAADLWIV